MEANTSHSASDSLLRPEEEVKTAFPGKVLVNERITLPDSPEDVRHIEIEIENAPNFQLGQNLGVLVPGPHAFGNDHHLRLYTLSGAEVFPGSQRAFVSICVRRCLTIDDFTGEAYRGVASNFLCDSNPGDTLNLTGPYGSPFPIPQVNSANLLMIGLGTGIAPFRHFIQHIYEVLGGWQGKIRLFYGAHSGLEMLYQNDYKNDFAKYYDERTFRAFEAMSPEPHLAAPPAVADALLENRQEVWELIEAPDTFIYVAGLAAIHDQLERALVQMAGSEKAWRTRLQNMKAVKRWTEVIY